MNTSGLLPTTLNFMVNDICNSRCKMCRVWKQQAEREITPEELSTILRDPLFSNLRYVGISGGEPTLRRDLPEIFRVIACKGGIKGTGLITNALDAEHIIKQVTRCNEVCMAANLPFNVMVSLDGIGKVHDTVRGRKGAFENALQVIRYVRDNTNIAFSIGCTVIKQNVWHLDEVLDFCGREKVPGRFRIGEFINRLYNRDLKACIRNFDKDERYQIALFFSKLELYYESSPAIKATYRNIRQMIFEGKPRESGCPYRSESVGLDSRCNLLFCSPKSPDLGSCLEKSATIICEDSRSIRESIIQRYCSDCIHDYHSAPSKESLEEYAQEERLRNFMSVRQSIINSTKLPSALPELLDWSKFKKALIVGWYGTETAGDKAIISDIIRRLKDANSKIQITVGSLYPFVTSRTLYEIGVENIRVIKTYSPEYIDTCKSTDAVVMGGGPLMGMEPLGFVLTAFSEARKANIPCIIEGCGIGPLIEDIHIMAVKEILRLSKQIRVRDKTSLSWVSENTGRFDAICTGDPAAGFVEEWKKETLQPQEIKSEAYFTCLLREITFEYANGKSLTDFLAFRERFEKELGNLIRHIREKTGLKPFLMPMHTFAVGQDDRDFARRFAETNLQDGDYDIGNKVYSPQDILSIMSRSKFNVCMRFHSVLFAEKLDVPFVAIDYTGGGKIKGFLKDQNKLELMFDNTDLRNQNWRPKIDTMLLKHSLRSMNVVHLCSQDYGGAGKAAYRLHKGLQQIGVASTMLVVNKKSGDPSVKVLPSKYLGSLKQSLNVPTYESQLWPQQVLRWETELAKYPNRPAGLEIFTDALSDIQLEQIQDIRDADIINLHWVAGTLDYLKAPLALRDKKIVWTLHDMNPFTGGCHYSGDCEKYKESCGACPQLGATIEEELSRQIWNQKFYAFQSLDLTIVTPSKWLANCASQSRLLSKNPVKVIPNGFPLDTFKPHTKAEIRRALNIPENAKVILFGADYIVNTRKGFAYLLEALRRLLPNKEYATVVLTFGNFPEGIQINTVHTIFNLGSITDENKLALAYSAADVFVIPSLEDNLPNTVVEAMACGVPVVGFNIGGVPEMVDHKKTGFLVRPRDIAGLIEGIDWVISSSDSGTSFSKQCREKVEKEYALDVQAKAYCELYCGILQDYLPLEEDIRTKAGSLNQQGEDLFTKGDLKGALDAFTRAIEINPNLATARNNLGVLYYNRGEKDKALNQYQQGVQLAPENITFQKNLADFYYVEQGRVEEAMQIYVKVLNENPEDIETLLVLAHICVAIGKFDDAKYFSSRILKIEPGNKDAMGFLEKLEKCKLSDAVGRLDPENNRDKTSDMNKRALNRQGEDLFAKGDLEGASEGLSPEGKNYSGKPVNRETTIDYAKNEQPMISIITPSLNQGQYIEQTIQMVQRQNYSNFEHIIIDGGSTDGTLEIFKRYPHLKSISEKDSGQSEALNKGLRIAKGEIVGWINSDDWYEPGTFELITSFFKVNPTKNVVMGNCNLVDENGIIFDKVNNDGRGFEELKKYWIGRSIPTQPAVFFRRKLLDQHGYIDETLHYAMDYDLWMRFAQNNHFYHLDVTVANYRFHQAAKGGDQDWNKFVPEWKLVSDRYTKLPGSTPLISVIIPCYNYGNYLCEAVESVIDQTYKDFEIIIVNDGSHDNTQAVAENLIVRYPDHQIRLISQENSGQPAISRNRGIADARGRYILCLDGDDMILPTMLEKCLNLLEQNENIAIAYTDRQDFDGFDQVICAGNYNFSRLKYANQISYCALFRNEVWKAIGGYRTNIKGCEDWDFWIAAGARGYFGSRIPEPLFKYRRHDTGVYQEVLKNYPQKHAQIVMNNPEAFEPSEMSLAKKILGRKSGEGAKAGVLVSVIVPTFNRPHMLKEALGSILSQTYRDFEIIVVNDGGMDISELIQNFQDPRIKCFQHKKNMGLAATRNTGIKNALGQFIALLDDDDIFLPEHLEIAVKSLSERHPVVYTDAFRATYERCGSIYKLLKKNVPYSIDFDRNKLLIGNISPVNCFVFDKNLASKAGLFDEKLSTLEDWEFWIRLSALTPFKHVAQPTVQVNWRNDGTTMTSSLGPEFKKNRERICSKYQNEMNQIPNKNQIYKEFQKIWAQDWHVESQLTSIIILTHNELELTKKCVNSIINHTTGAYEIIFVDNGSSDQTCDYLTDLVQRQQNFNLIANSENKGFAAGNNQGIAAARGDYVLLMNNDIVVTPSWLTHLISCAEQDQKIGIVGPVSNYVSGPQLVKDVTYNTENLDGLNDFASEFSIKHSGKATLFWRVVGFCMLIKRAVIDKIGGLDTRYGLGNFEDDDFSLRATLAGYESRIAEDCFVHHFGNRTFIAARIDYKKSLNNNWEIFKDKWGIPKNVPYGSYYDLSFLLKDGFIHSKHYAPIGEIAGLETSNAKETPPNSNQENYFEIQELITTGKKQEATEALEKLLLDDPEFVLAHNDLGVLYFQAGDKAKALKHYERAVALQPVNVTFLKNLADFYCLELGRIEEALKIYVNILITHPQDVETLMATGQICIALEKPGDARDFINRVLDIEPWNTAARQLIEVLKRPPTMPDLMNAESPDEIYQNLQSMLSNLSPDEVIGHLRKLMESFPDFALVYNDLGVLYYNGGDKEKALNYYQKAVQLEPTNATFMKNLADYYLVELGRKEDALQIYLSLLNHHPNDLEMSLTAAHICVALHNFSKAKVLYKRVLVIDPENEDARNNLRLLDKIEGDLRTGEQPNTESLQKSTPEEYAPAQETVCVIDGPEKDIPQFTIIMPTSAPLKQIRRCVESIKKHTSESHEILFVNNDNTKGVSKWVRQVIDGNHNCRLVKYGKGANPAVCYNTGIKAARGEYIVLLSNDVVVTDGWLSSMLQCFSSIPHAGMVGTMANRAKGRQKVAAAVNPSFTEIDGFAESYRATNRYRRIVCDILDGYCLLFRRDLTEKIGLFDEQMGALGFEDEDYCLRATLKGYVNQIAGDVYLHRLERKAPSRSKKNFNLKWSGADVQSQTGKRHLALRAVQKANKATEEGKIDLAVELFLQAIGLLPEHRESYYKLAEMLVNTKRFQDALDVLNELPEGDVDERQLALAACCKEGLDLLEEAEGYADRALELNRFGTSALNTKGIIAFRRDDKNAAESYFVRAMEMDPGFGEAYTNLGALKWVAGLKEEALSLYERGFILSPTVPDIALNYHCALADLCEYQRAESVLRDAAAVHPRNKKIRYMLIDVLIHQRNHGMAMQEIETAIADFGIDDGILSSALKIRKKTGPLTISRKTGSRSTVSLCMIVKDEEEHLAKCLQSVRPVVDEIIVVDTGSRDRSRDIARVFGAKVFDFEWAGDFAEARNYSLSKANGKMVFVMDADEVISPLDYELFRQTAKQSSRQRSAFIINTRNYTMDNNLVGWVANEGYYDIEEAGTGWTPSAKIRLFPNESHIRFNFPVHEMVEPSLQKMGIAMKLCKFQVHHYGKLNRDKSEKKGEAYYEIGCKKLEEMGDAPVALRELAIQAEGLKKHEEAIELWQRFIAIVPNEPKAYINMGISYCSLGQFDKVLATAEKALKFAPDSKEGHYNCALAKLHLGHPDQAIEILEKLCEKIPEYLPARFILAAAWCCREDKKRGMVLLKELSGTTIGPGLAIRCHELASRFVLLQRPAYALALLNAAIDSQNANKDVLDLYADCLKRTDFHKKTGTYE